MKKSETQPRWTRSESEFDSKELNRAINIMIGAFFIGAFILAGIAGCALYLMRNY